MGDSLRVTYCVLKYRLCEHWVGRWESGRLALQHAVSHTNFPRSFNHLVPDRVSTLNQSYSQNSLNPYPHKLRKFI